MNNSPGTLETLSSRVDDLEKRVRALEHPAQFTATAQVAEQNFQQGSEAPSILETGNIFPVIGRAMLGIAGAYVLRALAEAATSSKLPISIFAVAYAFAWLVWSPRASGSTARVFYAATSVLILAPMLWENTLGFHLFTPTATAGILAGFITLATTLDLRKEGLRSMGIAQSVALLTTAALAFATHEVSPFVAALLIAVFITEFARTRDLPQPLWPLIVLVSDAAVWAFIFIYASPQDSRANYHELNVAALIAPASILFALNASAVSVRVFVRKNTITFLDIFQLVIAFALAATSALYFAPLRAPTALGISCFVLSTAAYAAAFHLLRSRRDRRNFRVFALWSAALLIAASLWALPHAGSAILMALASTAAVYLSRRIEPKMLQFHGALFLLIAVLTTGLPLYLYDCMAGTPPHSPSPAVLVLAICAAAAVVVSPPSQDGFWNRALYLFPPLVSICASTALLVHAALAIAAAFMILEAQHIAFLRTLTISAAALVIAFGGSRLHRNALTHLAYVALAFLAAKLFFEDLRHGHMEFIAASIGLFAITLMATPKLVRMGAGRQTALSNATLHTKV